MPAEKEGSVNGAGGRTAEEEGKRGVSAEEKGKRGEGVGE